MRLQLMICKIVTKIKTANGLNLKKYQQYKSKYSKTFYTFYTTSFTEDRCELDKNFAVAKKNKIKCNKYLTTNHFCFCW